MSRFYRRVRGNKGAASRCGSTASGLQTYTASEHGAVRCQAWYNAEAGEDWVDVSLVPWRGSGTNALLYRGPIGRYVSGTGVQW